MENLEELMEPELKKAVDDIIQELKASKLVTTELTAFTELDSNVITEFCENNNLTVFSEFKTALTTPYALAKYIMLSIDQASIIKKIENELSTKLDNEKVKYTIYKNFSNQIAFEKVIPLNSDEKPQQLLVKYRIDQDTNKIIYSILGGHWGWDVTINQLKALLENQTIVGETISKTVANKVTNSQDTISLDAFGIKIIIQKP